jgi:hypothetical protein
MTKRAGPAIPVLPRQEVKMQELILVVGIVIGIVLILVFVAIPNALAAGIAGAALLTFIVIMFVVNQMTRW